MSLNNEFGRFFYTDSYIQLKNHLFNYRLRKNYIKEVFSRFFKGKSTKKGFSIIDIGSGISPVTPLPGKTRFIELEKEAVDFLRKKNLDAMQGDITKLKLKSNSVDFIVCSEVLEHVKEYKKGLKEMNRILKRGGGAIITVPIHQHYWKDDDEFVGHLRRFNPETLQNELGDAGFEIVLRKPIGSRLERFFTWLTVKVARKTKTVSTQPSKLNTLLFYLANSMLIPIIKIANLISSEKSSSIILFVAIKK